MFARQAPEAQENLDGQHILDKLHGWQDSEAVLVERLFDQVPKDALLLEDRGFFSYQAWKRLRLRGLQLLVRIFTSSVPGSAIAPSSPRSTTSR